MTPLSSTYDHQIKSSAGRTISYAVYGDPSLRRPVIYFHGFPGSRIEAFLGFSAAKELGVSIIAFDRPGLGGTTFKALPCREGVVDDVRSVADHLGLNTFSIVAVSGGAGYAFETAAALGSDRVRQVHIVSGMGPVEPAGVLDGMNRTNRTLLEFGLRYPATARNTIGGLAKLWRLSPGFAALWFGAVLPPPDRSIVTRISVAPVLRHNLIQSLTQGSKGVVQEYSLLLAPWKISGTGLRMPVRFWHGDADTYVPLGMTRHMAGLSGQSTIKIVPGGGHFVFVDIIEEVLGALEWR